MDRVKHILIKLLVVFISFFFIDGGKTIFHIGNNVQILLNHHQNRDFEIPHQHNLNKYDDDEKWMRSNSFELLYSYTKPVLLLHYIIISTEDYAGSVWQPPKFI